MSCPRKTLFCSVPGCPSEVHRNPNLLFHNFPTSNTSFLYITDALDVECKIDNRELWEMLLLFNCKPTAEDRVCSLHFQDHDYVEPNPQGRIVLCKLAFPTLNLPQDASSMYIEEVDVDNIQQNEVDNVPYDPLYTEVNFVDAENDMNNCQLEVFEFSLSQEPTVDTETME